MSPPRLATDLFSNNTQGWTLGVQYKSIVRIQLQGKHWPLSTMLPRVSGNSPLLLPSPHSRLWINNYQTISYIQKATNKYHCGRQKGRRRGDLLLCGQPWWSGQIYPVKKLKTFGQKCEEYLLLNVFFQVIIPNSYLGDIPLANCCGNNICLDDYAI